MIKIHLFSISVIMAIYSCGFKHNQTNESNSNSFELSLKKIIINQYKDDSLNNIRNLILPIMYYDFEGINNGQDTLGITLNDHGENRAPFNAFVVFTNSNKKDTLVLSNFANEKKIVFPPKDTTGFIIKGFIPDLNEYLDMMSAKELMTQIAENGDVIVNIETFNESNKTPTYLKIERSSSFKIEYRDPNDTTVE